MKLQQTIVVATHATNTKRNRIIAKSAGIDKQLFETLPAWCPCRDAMMVGHKTATFFTPINDRQSIVGRSSAGPYDAKGNRPLVSTIVVVQNAQLKAFHNNPVLLLKTLASSGHLVLNTAPPKALPAITMPNSSINYFGADSSVVDAQRVLKALEMHSQVALMDVPQPLDSLGRMLNQLPSTDRARLSFSIGRRFTPSAPFDISFYPNGGQEFDQELVQHQIFPVQCGVRKRRDREMV